MNANAYSPSSSRLTRPLFLTALLVLSAVLVMLSHRANPVAAAPPGYSDMIVFYRYVEPNVENAEIFVMNSDGTGQTRLTYNDADDWLPAWSPDGTQIAFVSDRDGNREIYVMNADGSDPTRLTYNAAADHFPAWSADGTRIAFHSNRDGSNSIYVMNADGSATTRLTEPPGPDGEDGHPTWSPDGTRIAFERYSNGFVDIFVMNADGSGQTNITSAHSFYWAPAWSPDGTQILFTNADTANADIYVMNTDGSGRINLTNNPAGDDGGAWSPDGTQIAFERWREGIYDIYVMNADGSGQTNLTNNEASEHHPDWGRVEIGPIGAPVVTATPDVGQVSLSWTAPFPAGHPGSLTYSVLYRPVGNPVWQTGPAGLATLTTTIGGLAAGIEYEFGVFATANDGVSGELGTTTTTVGGACPDVPGNLIQNYCFEEGNGPWIFWTDGKGTYTTSSTDPYQGQYAGVVAIQKQGSNVQLYQKDIPLEPNTTYELSFAAHSSNGNDLSVWMHKHAAPFTNYGLADFRVRLETGWNLYQTTFTTAGFSDPVNDARLRFWLGPFDAGNMSYHVDWVVLREVDGSNPSIPPDPPVIVPPPGQCSPTAGNLIANPGYENGTNEWTFWTDGAGFFDTSNADPYECAQNGRVTIGKQGSNVQLYQRDITLQGGETYQLRLAARSSGGQDVQLYVHKHGSPFTNYGLNGVRLDLTSDWQGFVVEFTAVGTVPLTDARLRFWLAPYDEVGAVFEFDDVVLLPKSAAATASVATAAFKAPSISMSSLAADEQLAVARLSTADWVPADSVQKQGYFLDGDEQGRLEGGRVDKNKDGDFCASARPSRAELLPANGKMAKLNITGLGRVKNLTITGITQDEAVGGPQADAMIDGSSIWIRQERNDGGEGRVYTIAFTATSSSNQSCRYEVVIGVPLDNKTPAIDNGTEFDSMAAAP